MDIPGTKLLLVQLTFAGPPATQNSPFRSRTPLVAILFSTRYTTDDVTRHVLAERKCPTILALPGVIQVTKKYTSRDSKLLKFSQSITKLKSFQVVSLFCIRKFGCIGTLNCLCMHTNTNLVYI